MFKNIALIILVLTIPKIATAEVYKDFEPFLSLKVIKERYPNAVFSEIKAAWVKQNEVFLDMHGAGISGNIYLKLSAIEYEKKLDLETNPEMISFYQRMINKPQDERLTLDWVRWIPINSIPFERLTTRYGKAEKCDYLEENFIPYCSWESKGVLATLSNDKKNVIYIEYSFTEKDFKKKWEVDDKTTKPTKKAKPKTAI